MIELNSRTIEPPYYKFIKRNHLHYKMTYKLGLNVDINPFNPSGMCSEGGLYFTSGNHIGHYVNYGPVLCEIELCEDSKVWFEGEKAKTDKFIIVNMYKLLSNDINDYLYNLLKSFKGFNDIDKKYGIDKKYFNILNKKDINNINYLYSLIAYNKCHQFNELCNKFKNKDINLTIINNILDKIDTLLYYSDKLVIIYRFLQKIKVFPIFNIKILNKAISINNIRIFKNELNKFNGDNINIFGDILITLCMMHESAYPEMVKLILRKFNLNKIYLNKALYEACHRENYNEKYEICNWKFRIHGYCYTSIINMLLEAGADITFDINKISGESIKKRLTNKVNINSLNIIKSTISGIKINDIKNLNIKDYVDHNQIMKIWSLVLKNHKNERSQKSKDLIEYICINDNNNFIKFLRLQDIIPICHEVESFDILELVLKHGAYKIYDTYLETMTRFDRIDKNDKYLIIYRLFNKYKDNFSRSSKNIKKIINRLSSDLENIEL